MKTFAFFYQSKGGLVVTGKVKAQSRSAAIEDLKNDSEGIILLTVVEVEG
jgi:hypothetical protein